MLRLNHYNLQPTSPESTFQIGKVERLHQSLASMMRTMLLGSNLSSKFWSDAILHAVCVKNHLPHQSLHDNIAPHEAWTNERPDLSHLKVFGSSMHTKKPGIRKDKLNASIITKGIFLSFTLTKRNAMHCHPSTCETKTSQHCVIDEVHYSNDKSRPKYAEDILNGQKITSAHPPCNFIKPNSDPPSHATILPSDLCLTSSCAPSTISYKLFLKGNHPYLGFKLSSSNTNYLIIDNIETHTSACRIPHWCTTLQGRHVISINNTHAKDKSHFSSVIANLMDNKHRHAIVTICPIEKINNHVDSTAPQISFDQMSIMAYQHNAVISNSIEWRNLFFSPSSF